MPLETLVPPAPEATSVQPPEATNALPAVRFPHRLLPQFDRALSARTALLQALVAEVEFAMDLAADGAIPQAKRIHGLRRSLRRARAVVHDGLWFHLSTPPDLAEAEQVLEARITGETR